MSHSVSHLKQLDYAVIQQCMHCGMCLPTCPTYDATRLERNSPRGRIALMRAIADGELEATRSFAEEMYYCLGCLACVTACPADVNYAELFEHARAEAEKSGVLDSPRRRVIRAVTLRWLFMEPDRLKLVGRLLRLYQQLGIQALIRRSGLLRCLPRRLRELEAMTPDVAEAFTDELVAPVTPARGRRRYRVAVLSGCAQDLVFSGVNRDTVEVLAENGCEVVTPPSQPCCGSLHAHNGEWESAQILARRSIDQFPPDEYDAIITNAAGCGSHLKHYGSLLADDPAYRRSAEQWDRTVKDIHEWLVEIDATPPTAGLSGQDGAESGACRITYHEACHLCHGQKIRQAPNRLLAMIPGTELVELPEATWCCGSAGIYNLIQPEMANDLLERKVRQIRSTAAQVVATANPGCLLHIGNGMRDNGSDPRLAHPVSLLAEAYRRGRAGDREGSDTSPVSFACAHPEGHG